MTTAEATKIGDIKEEILAKIAELLKGDADDQVTVATLAGAYRALADASS